MNKSGPVIIIEDNKDDQEMLERVFKNLKYNNDIVFFVNANSALEYLNNKDVNPFLILSDINMPHINGIELRSLVHTNEQLQLKCIPYLFFTVRSDMQSVVEAYSLSAQGYFIKPVTIDKLENTIRKIMEYWEVCIAPSEYA